MKNDSDCDTLEFLGTIAFNLGFKIFKLIKLTG